MIPCAFCPADCNQPIANSTFLYETMYSRTQMKQEIPVNYQTTSHTNATNR
jgi:hypothetical protein